VAEARAHLQLEADYVAEAENLRRYAALVASCEPDCVVPGVHADLTTHRILAMDRMSGARLRTSWGPPGTRS